MMNISVSLNSRGRQAFNRQYDSSVRSLIYSPSLDGFISYLTFGDMKLRHLGYFDTVVLTDLTLSNSFSPCLVSK